MWYCRRPVGAGLAVAVCAAGGGCLAFSTTNVTATGAAIDAGTFDHAKVGEATAEWAKATLGEPSIRVQAGDDDEIWKYVTTEKSSHGDVIVFVYLGTEEKTRTRTYYLEFVHKKRAAKWQD